MSWCRGKVKVQPGEVTKDQCSQAHFLDHTLNPYLAGPRSLFFHNLHIRDQSALCLAAHIVILLMWFAEEAFVLYGSCPFMAL